MRAVHPDRLGLVHVRVEGLLCFLLAAEGRDGAHVAEVLFGDGAGRGVCGRQQQGGVNRRERLRRRWGAGRSQASVERVAIFPTNVALVPITMPSTGIEADMTAASCQPRRKAKV